MNFSLKKRDFIILLVFLIICLIPFIIFKVADRGMKERPYKYLSIQIKGKEIRQVRLTGNTEKIEIPLEQNGKVKNRLVVDGEHVDMIEADCPDQLCVLHNPISEVGETIICLPNKVVLEIKGSEGPPPDGDVNTF